MLSGISLALVHKHVNMSVGKWIMATTHLHKHVHINKGQLFLPHFVQHDYFPIIFYLKLLNSSDFTINSNWYRYTINLFYGR